MSAVLLRPWGTGNKLLAMAAADSQTPRANCSP
eukprot:COSAG01_NODE_36703_length_513_cov_3.475845_1_plen_32_part_10